MLQRRKPNEKDDPKSVAGSARVACKYCKYFFFSGTFLILTRLFTHGIIIRQEQSLKRQKLSEELLHQVSEEFESEMDLAGARRFAICLCALGVTDDELTVCLAYTHTYIFA